MSASEHEWTKVVWASGRWKGHVARREFCPRCERSRTRRSEREPCPGKPWAQLTHDEQVKAMASS